MSALRKKGFLAGFFVLLICGQGSWGETLAVYDFTKEALTQEDYVIHPVEGYEAVNLESAMFPLGEQGTEGYWVELQPGEASLLTLDQSISHNRPIVLTLEYSVLEGHPHVAVVGFNEGNSGVDGQLGYTQVQEASGEEPYAVQRIHVVYDPPSGTTLPAFQSSLSPEAEQGAKVVFYRMMVNTFEEKADQTLPITPRGTFDQNMERLIKNVNQDQGEVIVDEDNQRVLLQTAGEKEAANAGVRIDTSGITGGSLFEAQVEVRRLEGEDGKTALVLTDSSNRWTTALFVENASLPDEQGVSQLKISGFAPRLFSALHAFVQNGGGQNPASTAVDNLEVKTLSMESILGLPQPPELEAPLGLAAAMMIPEEFFQGSHGSFSLSTLSTETKKPLSVPYEFVVKNGLSERILHQGYTDSKGFASASFSVPEWDSGTWDVELHSLDSTLVRGSAAVKEGGALFIETDKPIYKPGQEIQGRVLLMNNSMSPLAGEVELTISDAKGIKIHKEILTTNDYGVASFTLPLANELNFGMWKISARGKNDFQSELDVEVDQYVLPSFEVKLETSKDWYLVDERVSGAVESRFFFGKPVQGRVKIEARRYVGEWETYATAEGRLDEEGRFAFDLPAVDYVAGTPGAGGDGTLQLKVSVTDDTGHEEKTDAVLKIVDAGVTIQLIPESNVIKPGLNQELLVVTKTPGGQPLSLEADIEMIFISADGTNLHEFQDEVETENGLGTYAFEVPEKTAIASITVRAEHEKRSTEEYIILEAVHSPASHFIHLRQRNEGVLQVGEEAVFDVFATNEGTVYYDVYANGRTLFSKAVDSQEIRFTVTPGMSPKAKIVAYMIQEDMEVSADVLPFEVELAAPVDLQAQFSAEEVRPGDSVSLSLQAEEQSMLGVSIVDESVFALARGRLNLRNVFAQLEQIFMEPKIEVHPGDDIWTTPSYGSQGTADVLRDHKMQVLTTPGLNVPEGKEIDSRVFWGPEFRTTLGLPPGLQLRGPEEDAIGGDDKNQSEYQEPERVRTFFPETWVWRPELLTNESGEVQLDLTAPDSITTWKLHAVSTSQQGMGITEGSLRVFQDFFVEPDLPYAVIRGDRFPMRVGVFNYLDKEQQIRITLEEVEGLGLQDDPVKEITVPAQSLSSATFTLEPNKVGQLPISLVAQSAQRADALEKTLRVEPEGVRHEQVHNGYIEAGTEVTIPLDLPKPIPEPLPREDEDLLPEIEIVPDSEQLRIAVTGSLLGQSIEGLDDLLGMPYGCGEQNMIFLAPDIEVLRYLKATGQLAPDLRAKAEHFITTGYQRQLTFRRNDGSFSAFGQQDDSGSLWLTAFVLSTFSNAREVRHIDETVLSEAADWILSHQQSDGLWESVGFVVHQEMVGGTNGRLALSAFVTNALLEYGEADADKVDKALEYLEDNVSSKAADDYGLALIAYALTQADRPSAEQAVDALLERSKHDGQGIYWQPHPIEATSYAAMALMNLDRVEAQAALEWLATQRNSMGGHGSTQDTVVAFKALTQAAINQSRDLNATVEVVVNDEIVHSFQIHEQNFDVLQSLEWEPVNEVTLKITGKGKVLYQVVHAYNLPAFPEPIGNNLGLKVDYSSEHVEVDDIVDVKVTVDYLGPERETGMSIVDVSIPTGFALVQDSIEQVKRNELIKRVEPAGRKVIFYIDHLSVDDPLEFMFQVRAKYPVKADSGTSSAYLYYEPDNRVEAGGVKLRIGD